MHEEFTETVEFDDGEWCEVDAIVIISSYYAGCPARINYNENDHPADPPEVEFEVKYEGKDITDELSGKQIERLTERCLEHMADAEDYKREVAADMKLEAMRGN